MDEIYSAKLASANLVVTPAAYEVINGTNKPVIPLLERFVSGDWGAASASDKKLNDGNLNRQGRLLGVYELNKQTLWIMADQGWQTVTILTPGDY